jgi:hypothetical protein
VGLHWYYRNDDGDIVELVGQVQFAGSADEGTDGLVTNAEEGSVGRAQIRVDDPTGTFSISGHRKVYAVEDEAIDDDYAGVIGVYYTNIQEIVEGSPFDGVGRVWVVSLDDLNTVLDRRILLWDHWNRPAETDVERVMALYGRPELALIDDDTYISSEHPVRMSKADYRKQKARDLLDDCAQQGQKNWYVLNLKKAPDEAGDTNLFSLWYGKGTLDTFVSPVEISNVPADIAGGAYPPAARQSRLKRDPERVFSTVVVEGDGFYRVVSRPATAAAFALGGRDTNMAAPNVKDPKVATARGLAYVEALATQVQRIETAIVVDAADVNAIVAGQYASSVRFSWMTPPFDTGVPMRAVTRTVRPLAPGKYEIALELDLDSPLNAALCEAMDDGEHHPLGGPISDAEGRIHYLRAGLTYPEVATPDFEGHWHFPEYGAGGSGTVDYAGDCTGSFVRFIVSGTGTATIHTATYSGQSRNLVARLQHRAGAEVVVDETQTGATGDDFEFEVDTHGGVNCDHWIDVIDNGPACGSKWGFAGAEWAGTA